MYLFAFYPLRRALWFANWFVHNTYCAFIPFVNCWIFLVLSTSFRRLFMLDNRLVNKIFHVSTEFVSSLLISQRDWLGLPIVWATMWTIRPIVCFLPPQCLVGGHIFCSVVTQTWRAFHSVEQEFLSVLCWWALWYMHHQIFYWWDLDSSKERQNEKQYNFQYHVFAIVLSEPTSSNHPLPHCSHPQQRKTFIAVWAWAWKNPASNKAVDISNAHHGDDMTKEECKRFVLMVCVRKKY